MRHIPGKAENTNMGLSAQMRGSHSWANVGNATVILQNTTEKANLQEKFLEGHLVTSAECLQQRQLLG